MGALGVPPDSKGAGCTPVEHRRAIQGLFENTGILYGLDVTGTSGLAYNVGAGAAVCQRNAQDGYSIAWSDGGRVTAPEGGAGGVDVVWIRANDASQGDPDNSVQLGCSRGAAPAGCVPIAYRQAPAGSSATESRPATGARVDYAKPRGAANGLIAYGVVDAAYMVDEDQAWHEQVKVSFALATNRHISLRWKAFASVGEDPGQAANGRMGSYYVQFRLDGQIKGDMTHSGSGLNNEVCDEIDVNRYTCSRIVELDLDVPAGVHQVSVWAYGNKSPLTYPVTLYRRRLEVIDRGLDA